MVLEAAQEERKERVMKQNLSIIFRMIKCFLLLTLISCFSPQLLFARTYEYEIYRFEWDLDNDGHKETIRAFQKYDRSRNEPVPDPVESWKPDLTQKGWERITEVLPLSEKYPTPIEVVVTILNPVTKITDSFSLPGGLTYKGVKPAQLNDDGYYQILLTTRRKSRFLNEGILMNFVIYGYKEGRLYEIFEKLNVYCCTFPLHHAPPFISFSKTKKCGDGSHADRIKKELWVWDGKKFNKTNTREFWGAIEKSRGESKVLKWQPPRRNAGSREERRNTGNETKTIYNSTNN